MLDEMLVIYEPAGVERSGRTQLYINLHLCVCFAVVSVD